MLTAAATWRNQLARTRRGLRPLVFRLQVSVLGVSAFVMVCSRLALAGDAAVETGPQRAYGPHAFLARSKSDQIRESSGIAPSHFDPDVFWTCNDSDQRPRVYALRLSAADRQRRVAADLGYVELRGARCSDWEDMAPGPGHTLYVFDGGNNPPCRRADTRILRFAEPRVDWTQGPIRQEVRVEFIHFDYPDPARPGQPAGNPSGRYDAECLLVHPESGDLYIVTKRDVRNQVMARVYRLPGDSIRWNSRSVHVLEFVTDLSKVVPGMVTGGAVAPDGRRIVLRTYLAAYEFTLPPGRPFETIFQEKPQAISLLGEPQGEAICYARNGDLITTSEAIVLGPRFPIFITPVATQPASAPAR